MKVAKNDMVLIDAGCSWNNYASDITRTFSRNRKFSGKQKAVYNAVLHTHKNTVAAVKPGVSLRELHDLSTELISEQLIDLKLLKCSKDEAVENRQFMEFYPHYIGHHLGLDVHDCDGIPQGERRDPETKLDAGMVITIEPGIYVQPDNKDVPRPWLGLAVRIEDDILVTKEGNENLTDAAFKELKDLES